MDSRAYPMLLAFLLAGAAPANTITVTASAQVDPNVGPACTEVLSGGPATASCSPQNSPTVISTATYYGSFSGSVETEAGDILYDAYGVASITDSTSEYLVVTGGTGTGTLIFNYLLTGQGGETGNTGASLGFVTNFGSFFNPPPSCGSEACSWSAETATDPSGSPESVTIPFTFGTPFLLDEEFELSATLFYCSYCEGFATAQVSSAGFSVVDSNSNPVPGAQLTETETPEPGSLDLVGFLIALLVWRVWSAPASASSISLRPESAA
jgi:hypothetical protein